MSEMIEKLIKDELIAVLQKGIAEDAEWTKKTIPATVRATDRDAFIENTILPGSNAAEVILAALNGYCPEGFQSEVRPHWIDGNSGFRMCLDNGGKAILFLTLDNSNEQWRIDCDVWRDRRRK